MKTAIVRAFEPGDELACRRIAAEAAMTSYGASMPELRDVFTEAQPLDPAEVRLVAVVDEQPIAFIELNGSHVENLFVGAQYQGKGLGSALLEEVEKTRAGDVTLSVFHANPRARALYELHGYHVVEDREITYHGVRQKVWFMRKARALAPRYKAVIFDFDGVLADSREWMVRTLIQLNREFGLQPLDEAAIEAMRGLSNREILRQMKVPVWKLPAMMKRGRELAISTGDDIRPFEGTEAALRTMKAGGQKLGLVTSNSLERVQQTLGPDVMALFDHAECGASLFGKARRLKRACRGLGLSPANAAYVGDETRDVEAALKAGLPPIAVGWGYAHAEPLLEAGAHEVVKSWEECGGVP